MSNKRIQVSDDSGSTWNTLPGNQGDYKNTLNLTVDTIFGQSYESQQPNLGMWTMTANGIFKGVSGYNCVIKKGGTPTTMTAEACTQVGSTKTYFITNAVKRVISYLDALTVLDGGVDHTADVLSIDYLTGQVTFKSAYTPGGAITVTGKYIPLVVIAKAKSFTLSQTQTTIDNTGYDDAQSNSGHRVYVPGLRTVSLQLGSIFAASSAWLTTILSRGICYVEIDLDATNPGLTVARGFFKVNDRSQQGNQGAVEDETISLALWVPDGSLVALPFSWYIANTSTLNVAIQKILASFVNQTIINGRYLPSGAPGASPLDGATGLLFPTECSLTNSIDGLNDYTFKFQGTGAPTAV